MMPGLKPAISNIKNACWIIVILMSFYMFNSSSKEIINDRMFKLTKIIHRIGRAQIRSRDFREVQPRDGLRDYEISSPVDLRWAN